MVKHHIVDVIFVEVLCQINPKFQSYLFVKVVYKGVAECRWDRNLCLLNEFCNEGLKVDVDYRLHNHSINLRDPYGEQWPYKERYIQVKEVQYYIILPRRNNYLQEVENAVKKQNTNYKNECLVKDLQEDLLRGIRKALSSD